jgi:cAMP-dependent protein kinase regulator/CRP/FNR family cyclic AMP-dependent transcriptional regulator/cGMP-dependent protein kinase 2
MDIAELERVGFIADLEADHRNQLSGVFDEESHPVGTALIVEGGDSTRFFVLLEGYVTVHREGSHLADLGPGDCFGEMGVVSKQSRNATVIATTPIRVAATMGWDLRDQLAANEDLRDRVEAAIVARSV